MRPLGNAIDNFGAAKASYQGMVDNRFRRRRPGVGTSGTSADVHYADESAFTRMREYIRAADRDDSILGVLADRAADNHVQGGATPEPKTGDAEVDKLLLEHWWDWALDKDLCDASGVETFPEMEGSVARADIVDGDVFVLPIEDGSIQLVEAHRCRTPTSSRRNIVHGIELDGRRRRLRYYFTKEDVAAARAVKLVRETDPVAAYDADGNPQVFHVYRKHRLSQTRGVTWFRGVIDILTQIEDTTLAASIKQQIAACAVWSWETDPNAAANADQRHGEREEQVLADWTSAINEGVSPGQMFQPPAGKKLNVHSPNLPGENFLPHQRHLLCIGGIQVGVPLFMALLDPSEGSFSSMRVAWEQAKIGFKRQQARRGAQFYSPTWKHRVRHAIAADPRLQAAHAKLGPKLFSHLWNFPGWKYIQPMHDAQAGALRVQSWQTSPRRLAAENGDDFEEVAAEIVADNSLGLELAAKAFIAFREKYAAYPEIVSQLTVRDFYFRDLYRGGQVIDQAEAGNDGGTAPAGPAKK